MLNKVCGKYMNYSPQICGVYFIFSLQMNSIIIEELTVSSLAKGAIFTTPHLRD
jgi:hypothetical protein